MKQSDRRANDSTLSPQSTVQPRGIVARLAVYRHRQSVYGRAWRLRQPRRDSINTCWRNKSFRGYAEYMQTSNFQVALETLIAHARQKRVALMCGKL